MFIVTEVLINLDIFHPSFFVVHFTVVTGAHCPLHAQGRAEAADNAMTSKLTRLGKN
jgi:hypothetical protein